MKPLDRKERRREVRGHALASYLWLLSLCVGLAIGAGIGAAIGRVGIGVAVGVGAGVSVGLLFIRRVRRANSNGS